MQSDILEKMDILVDMAGASLNIDTLKAELKEVEKESSKLREELDSLGKLDDEKYLKASDRQVDENIKVSLETKIKKQEKSILELQKQIDSVVLQEATLHDEKAKTKEEIRLSEEFIVVLEKRLENIYDEESKNYYKGLFVQENENKANLEKNLGRLEEEYSEILEHLNYLNLAKEEMQERLENEKAKLQETKANLVNPLSYIDEELKQKDQERIDELKRNLADLDKRRLEIITDPAIIASDAKELIVEDDRTSALRKVKELVTIVKSKPYMDVPSGSELSVLLQEEEQNAIDARDEFASLIDGKDYTGEDLKVVKNRIEYLNNEISQNDAKIQMLREEIKKIDSEEFESLRGRILEIEQIYNQLEQDIVNYKEIIESEIEDKTPKRRAVLATAFEKKQNELQIVKSIIDSYKEDQKSLINKAYFLEVDKIKSLEEKIESCRNEIVELNKILVNTSKAKDVLAIENDKRKLKELDDLVRDIKHRQKYSQTPSEIYDEIEMYLGTVDVVNEDDSSISADLDANNLGLDLDFDKQELEQEDIDLSSFDSEGEALNEVTESEVLEELPTLEEVETTTDSLDIPVVEEESVVAPERLKVVKIEELASTEESDDHSFVIGDYDRDSSSDDFIGFDEV